MLAIRWDRERALTRVVWTFEAAGPAETILSVEESGFAGDDASIVAQARDSTGGFNQLLVAAKACLDEPAWGHGYATEAARALLDWAFTTLDLIRVQSEVDTRNAASDRVLTKLGFVREGTLRENCIVDGEVSDQRQQFIVLKSV